MSSGASSGALPDRIQWEVDRFVEADVEIAVNQEEDLWVGSFARPFQGALRDFKVVFPRDYPEVGPIVKGPPGLLPRHQNPESGSLCLVDNETNWWRTWLSAMDLVRQLDTLLRATEEGWASVVAQEAPVAEPLTGHLAYRADRTVLVPDALLVDALGANAGTFRLLRINEHLYVVSELHDTAHKTVARAEPSVVALTRDQGAVGGWVQLDETPTVADLTDKLKAASGRALDQRNTWKAKPKAGQRARPQQRTRMTGVTFLEEGPAQGERRRAWVFAETQPVAPATVGWTQDRPIRAQAISDAQRRERIPELDGLGDVCVILVGAGSLGSGVGVELAKGVGELHIIDYDVYEPGNAVRHVLSVTDAGRPKSEALAELCRWLNPFCRARGYATAVGLPDGDPDWMVSMIEDADLIVETTGSHSVTRLLRRRAAEVGIPLITAALSVGGFGGRAVVLRPGGPCWDCFLGGQDRGDIPLPDEGPHHDRTPFGCSHPAASCAGFDVTHLAAVTARMAVQATLRTGYPPLDHDWTVLNFRPGSIPVQQGILAPDAACPKANH